MPPPTLRSLRAWRATALALAMIAAAPALAGSRGEVMFIDDFIRDPVLRATDWVANGPAATAMLTSLPAGARTAMVTPTMHFDSRLGLSLTAPGAPGQQSGIQTQFAYTPPFRIVATGTAASVGPGALEIGIATADAGSGVAIISGSASATAGFAVASAARAGKLWVSPPDPLSRDAPAAGKPYEFTIDVDSGGVAHLYGRSSGQVLGASQITVGTGPFYVVVGQASGSSAAGQPNIAYWRGVTISRLP
jgi:hypothetical protein